MKAAEIDTMSTAERLQTMEAIWDTLVPEANEISSPDWHQNVLATRRESIDSERFVSLEEARKRRIK